MVIVWVNRGRFRLNIFIRRDCPPLVNGIALFARRTQFMGCGWTLRMLLRFERKRKFMITRLRKGGGRSPQKLTENSLTPPSYFSGGKFLRIIAIWRIPVCGKNFRYSRNFLDYELTFFPDTLSPSVRMRPVCPLRRDFRLALRCSKKGEENVMCFEFTSSGENSEEI